MEDHINIREYRPEDENKIMEVFLENVPKYFAAHEAEEFRMFLREGPSNYYLILVSGNITGAGGFDFTADRQSAYLCWGFLAPAYHGKGIGRQLLDFRIKKISGNEHVTSLKVRTSQLAYKFFERNGFVLKQVVENFWAEGLDLYDMEYEIRR